MTNKHTIGKLGVWSFLDSYNFEQCAKFAQQIESLGYGAVWIPEAMGRDSFITLTVLAQATDSLYLATGIANLYARDAMAMKAARNALDELSGGRLILGIGVSHAKLVSGLRQQEYRAPLPTMRNYLQQMEQAMYAGPLPEKQGLLVLAALRDKMLGLSAKHSDGAHPYFVTPEHTARARSILGPDKFLAPEQKVLLETDASKARQIARNAMEGYLAMPNYQNNLLTLGFTESDFEAGGSDRLVDAIVAWGDETTIMKRIEAHWENGADHVCIETLRKDGVNGFDPVAIKALAPG